MRENDTGDGPVRLRPETRGRGAGVEERRLVALQHSREEGILVAPVTLLHATAGFFVDAILGENLRHQMDGMVLDQAEPYLQILRRAVRLIERSGQIERGSMDHDAASVNPGRENVESVTNDAEMLVVLARHLSVPVDLLEIAAGDSDLWVSIERRQLRRGLLRQIGVVVAEPTEPLAAHFCDSAL